MVEYNDWNGEKSDSPVVMTLKGKRWKHVDDASDFYKTKGRQRRRVVRAGRPFCLIYCALPSIPRAAAGTAKNTKWRIAPDRAERTPSKRVTASERSATSFAMALLVTIFLLVLLSQIISWIGTAVLQEFVGQFLFSTCIADDPP